MPIPQPNTGENEDQFVQRCMADEKMGQEYPDESQRYAVCVGQVGNVKNQDSYNDYPKAASENAKRALKFRDESGNPNGCGTQVGWTRANQLANREPISRETIARMSAFARHLQNEDVPYKEGCGGLMVDAWGGRVGIEWAQRKLKQIDAADKILDLIKEIKQRINSDAKS
jgi:hypothetical protein